MAYAFPSKISKKYLNGNSDKLKLLDIISHWLPTLISFKLNSNKEPKLRNIVSVYLLPWLYFSMKYKKNNTFGLTNPIKHVKETYPGVPMWVFSTWYIGSIIPYIMNYRRKRMIKNE